MKFSAFAQFGHFSFTAKPSVHEQFYRAYVANVKDAFDMSEGTHAEATAYARSKAAARAARTLERAGNAVDPLKATEILPNLEKDFGVIPGPFQDTPSRRRAVSVLKKLPAGGTYTAMRAALVTALGSDFLALRLLVGGEIVSVKGDAYLVSPRPEITPKICRILDPITNTRGGGAGANITVFYANIDPTAGDVLFVAGDQVVIDPNSSAQAEKLTAIAAAGVGTSRTVTFAGALKSHDAGAIVTTLNQPYWWSTRRTMMIVVTQAAAQSLEKRRVVDELMAKMVRGTAQWSIVQPAAVGGTTAGPDALPFVLGATPITANPFSLLP